MSIQRIRIDIADNCNIRCIMCQGYNHKKKSDVCFMSREIILSLVNSKTINENCIIQIGHQAEPLIHHDIEFILKSIRAQFEGAHICLLTNCLLLERYSEVINSYCSSLMLSLDSLNSKVYEKIRCRSSFKVIMKGLKKISVPVSILQTVMICNFDDIFRMQQFCKSRGFKFYNFPMSLRESGGEVSDSLLNESIFFDKDLLFSFQKNKKIKNDDKISLKECNLNKTHLYIRADGRCHSCEAIPIGSLVGTDLNRLLHSEYYLKIIENRKYIETKYCTDCELFHKCQYPDTGDISSYFSNTILRRMTTEIRDLISPESCLSTQEKRDIFKKAVLSSSYLKDCDVVPCKYDTPCVELIEEGYKNFNILKMGKFYYGIPQILGEVDAKRLESKAFWPALSGYSVDSVRLSIDNLKFFEPHISRLISKFFKIFQNIGILNKKNNFISIKEVVFIFCNINDLHRNGMLDSFPEDAFIVFGKHGKCDGKLISSNNFCYLSDIGKEGIEKIVKTSQGIKSVKVFVDAMGFEDAYLERIAFENNATLEFFVCGAGNVAYRLYSGEKLHRIYYSKSYLSSFLSKIPSLKGQRILDAGCSDGLICDLLSFASPSIVHGVDVVIDEKSKIANDKVNLSVCDLCSTHFEDLYFDTIFSLATFEHVHAPEKAVRELYRILKRGGYLCIQAGPLWFSPFGHHMFGYFDDIPWIHLRKNSEEIAKLAKVRGIDKKIEEVTGILYTDYINGMLSLQHVNKKFFAEYSLRELASELNMEVIHLQKSFEGKELLSDEIFDEICANNYGLAITDLYTHGFEVVFKKK